MKTVSLIQGSPEWHAHRAGHWNASDAPAMLGVSPHQSRAELMHEIHTGIPREFSDYAQRKVIDPGHAFEAQARKLVEDDIREELFPCTGVGQKVGSRCLSASFDGLTMGEDMAFEHKTLNEDIRATINDGAELPLHLRVQMEQQLIVSGAENVYFMASKWNGTTLEDSRKRMYSSDPELRARIIAGWKQFDADLAEYVPPVNTPAPAPVGKSPDLLPALRIELTGMVKASNLAEFRDHAMSTLDAINRTLTTDEDFANADETVKWCSKVEDQLAAAKQHALSQTADIDALFRMVDDVSAKTRAIRLELSKLVTTEKDRRKAQIVAAGVASVVEHYKTVNASLGQHAMSVPASMQSEIGAAIKGLRSLTSITDAVDTAATAAKIAASQKADAIRACVAALEPFAEHASLFPDKVQLCATKTPEDLRNLAQARIADHAAIEAERKMQADAAAERKRQQEAAEAQAKGSEPKAVEQPHAVSHELAAAFDEVRHGADAPPIKLGDINARIAPLSITADGLQALGFSPVGNKGAAKLYRAADFVPICRALYALIRAAAEKTP